MKTSDKKKINVEIIKKLEEQKKYFQEAGAAMLVNECQIKINRLKRNKSLIDIK